jgi:predicted flavoprotein YhiN
MHQKIARARAADPACADRQLSGSVRITRGHDDQPALPSTVVIVGAGAAGLMTAIVARRTWPDGSVTVLDGARQLGRKILISGGGPLQRDESRRAAADFNGGPAARSPRVLQAWTVDDTIAFFRGIGVDLREEPLGKLFPTTGRAATVLEALVRAATDAGAISARPIGSRRCSATASAS